MNKINGYAFIIIYWVIIPIACVSAVGSCSLNLLSKLVN